MAVYAEQEEELYSEEDAPISTLIDDVWNILLDKLTDYNIYVLSIAMPKLSDRLPRIQWVSAEYRTSNPYSCPNCIMRFSFMSAYNFHVMHDHRARTQEEFMRRLEAFFTLPSTNSKDEETGSKKLTPN